MWVICVCEVCVQLAPHRDPQRGVGLESDVQLQGEDVARVVRPHLPLPPPALAPLGRVQRRQPVGGEAWGVEAPGDTLAPGGGGGGGGGDEAAVPSLTHLPGHHHSPLRVAVEPPGLRDGRAGLGLGCGGSPSRGCSPWGGWRGPMGETAGGRVEPEDGGKEPGCTEEQEEQTQREKCGGGGAGQPSGEERLFWNLLHKETTHTHTRSTSILVKQYFLAGQTGVDI